jgi:phosphate transport system substrate-binding protein
MARILRTSVLASLVLVAACRANPPGDPITVDGSSTVFPLSEAVALDFMRANRGLTVNVAFTGTVEGFQRFCRGQLDIVDASRPITADERRACADAGVVFVELPVAHDAVTVIVNPANAWAASMTVAELRALWEPAAEGRVTTWRQVRSEWPDRPIALFGPGRESGTFDYFTEVVTGVLDASRKDYTASADDQAIVDGVAADPGALGYVGYSYFERNRDRLKALAVDDLDDGIGRGPIEPSPSNVGRGVYRPLGRPLFIYVNAERADRSEVTAFVQLYLRSAGALAPTVDMIPLMGTAYDLSGQRFARKITGSMFEGPDAARLGIDLLLARQ